MYYLDWVTIFMTVYVLFRVLGQFCCWPRRMFSPGPGRASGSSGPDMTQTLWAMSTCLCAACVYTNTWNTYNYMKITKTNTKAQTWHKMWYMKNVMIRQICMQNLELPNSALCPGAFQGVKCSLQSGCFILLVRRLHIFCVQPATICHSGSWTNIQEFSQLHKEKVWLWRLKRQEKAFPQQHFPIPSTFVTLSVV